MCWKSPAQETNISSQPNYNLQKHFASDVMKKVRSATLQGLRFSVSSIFFFINSAIHPTWQFTEVYCPCIFPSWLRELAWAGSRCTRGQTGSHTFVPKEQSQRCSGLWLNVGTVARTWPHTCLPGYSTRTHTDTYTSGSTCPHCPMLTRWSKLGQAAFYGDASFTASWCKKTWGTVREWLWA